MKAAVLANNHEMDRVERKLFETDIDTLAELIKSSSSTQSIVGGTVNVVDMQDYAFIGEGEWRLNPIRDSNANYSIVESVDKYNSFIQDD